MDAGEEDAPPTLLDHLVRLGRQLHHQHLQQQQHLQHYQPPLPPPQQQQPFSQPPLPPQASPPLLAGGVFLPIFQDQSLQPLPPLPLGSPPPPPHQPLLLPQPRLTYPAALLRLASALQACEQLQSQ
jgi:hypothetical protein